jgi:hypothetical protein
MISEMYPSMGLAPPVLNADPDVTKEPHDPTLMLFIKAFPVALK